MRYGEVRDCNVDYLLKKVWISAKDVVQNVGTQSVTTGPATLSVGWSVGSPTYRALPSSKVGGIVLAATLTNQIDYFWRVPSEVDKNHPLYFRHHWASQIAGTTPTVQFGMYVASLSSGTSLSAVSPTAVVNTEVPASSNTGTLSYNLTGRAAIAPLATGVEAFQLMGDSVEALHITIQANSTNWAIAQLPVWWFGMDVEYTPRHTYGDGSRREGRKLETNLGFQEVGASNDY